MIFVFARAGFAAAADPAPPAACQGAEPILIMPAGDSLTEGVSIDGKPDGGYRPRLYELLKARGCSFHFVGSNFAGPEALPKDERGNEGRGGDRIDEVAARIDFALDRYRPGIVLLGAGGNDETQRHDLEHAPERLLDLVRQIRRRRPAAIVLVQTRPARGDEMRAANEAFNREARRLLLKEHAVDSAVWLVDNADRVSVGQLLPDRRHPTPEGNANLAQGWFEAIMRALSAKKSPAPTS